MKGIQSLLAWIQRFSLLRNSIYIIGTGTVTSVLGYFFWILAAHLYTPSAVGLGSALISAMTLAALLANMGMGPTLVQRLPLREKGAAWSLTLNAGLVTGIVAGLFVGIIAVMALPLFSSQFFTIVSHPGYTVAFILSIPLMSISTLLDQTFASEHATQHMLIRNALVALFKIPLAALPVLLLAPAGGFGIFLAAVLAMAIVLIPAFVAQVPGLDRDYCLALRGMAGQVRSMFSALTGNYFINLGGQAAGYLLPVFVLVRLSAADNAYYYTATRVGDFLLAGSAAVATSLFAEGSHAAGDLTHKVRSSAKIIAFILAPGMLLCFLGGYSILLVFGQSYAAHGAIVLRIETISAVPDAITSVYVSVLRVHRRLRAAALLNLGMAGVMLVLAWLLLPLLGIAAVPVAVLLGESCGSVAAGIDILLARHRRLIVAAMAPGSGAEHQEDSRDVVGRSAQGD